MTDNQLILVAVDKNNLKYTETDSRPSDTRRRTAKVEIVANRNAHNGIQLDVETKYGTNEVAFLRVRLEFPILSAKIMWDDTKIWQNYTCELKIFPPI
jgi:hypothetical protein